jgi:hypothetical protein
VARKKAALNRVSTGLILKGTSKNSKNSFSLRDAYMDVGN